ncbi:bifunctional serine/threonine-protein kinase/universal stress protein [Undibacterium flavidum]|uniref:Protein kinase n=1 Tax=Undibacterium flavidum TaxID=2762297 RepID=A0ABR6YH91_9BURK|nr:bifunctional serine/threonine-protein kinase/universal stress protein [Undibacterium flavidum]MBC3875965.1 protein kinase [Undibacterium flavidum]
MTAENGQDGIDSSSVVSNSATVADTSVKKLSRLQVGMLVDGYQLEEKLHTGGMAALWRVTDLQQRFVQADGSLPALIMKVPLMFSIDDPTAIVAFEVEQMIMPKLKGKHVPKYYGAGDFDTQPFIVMEQIGGVSLRARFDAAPLPIDEVVNVGIKVATALQDLHRQHVIHLDLKPSNIMFRAEGDVVLIDYGLSRHDKLPDLLGEEFRLPMGTGPYIAPEQVLGIRNEPRSDQFSLGVLLYHLATGERPYGHPTSVAGLKKRLYRDPIPPRAHNAAIPDWLQEIILRCLEVEPGARFDTAAQLALMLQNPAQLRLTARAEKRGQDGMMSVLKRRFQAAGAEPFAQYSVSEHLSQAPIIMVALHLSESNTELADDIRMITRRLLQTEPGARLACVTIRKTSRIGLDDAMVQNGQNMHVKQLVELKHWARPLQVRNDKITFHVLEAHDPAAAIIDYAHNNNVDQIIIGSRGSSTLRRYLGSVSAQVVAEAECTVTVVKQRRE